MATKKKNPYENLNPSDPYNVKPDTRQSSANIAPPQAPPKPTPQSGPEVKYDKDGKPVGLSLPDGRNFLGLKPGEITRLADSYSGSAKGRLQREYAQQQETKNSLVASAEASQVDQKKNDLLIEQIGNLTPEQQALAMSDPSLSRRPEIQNILKDAGQKAAIAGTAGAVAGAAAGSVVPVIGTAIGAAGGAVGGAITGGVSAVFSEYKKVDKFNYDQVSENYASAISNMNAALKLANSGAGEDAQLLAIEKYNQGIAEIQLAERQLFQLSQEDQSKYIQDIRLRLNDVQSFRKDTLPIMNAQMTRAIQKPTASYVDPQYG